MEILPSKRFESHTQSANGLERPFGVKNDKYGPCHGADFYKNDTLSRCPNPENDTLFSGTYPYGKIYEYHPPPGGIKLKALNTMADSLLLGYSSSTAENKSFPTMDGTYLISLLVFTAFLLI